jgi:hypothetical protein
MDDAFSIFGIFPYKVNGEENCVGQTGHSVLFWQFGFATAQTTKRPRKIASVKSPDIVPTNSSISPSTCPLSNTDYTEGALLVTAEGQ